MPRFPRLRVKWWGRWEKEISLEEAESLIPFRPDQPLAVIVDGHRLASYEELTRLVAKEEYRDEEIIDVALIMPMAGGNCEADHWWGYRYV